MLPGLPTYLPNIIQSLAQDTGEPIPPAIFTSLLLCMVAGNSKHLILRTAHEEDVEEIKALVVRVLVTIFGLPTQRIALRPDDNAVDFLNDVFLVPPATSTSSANLLQMSPGFAGPAMASQKPRHSRMGSTATTASSRRPTSEQRSRTGHKGERSESISSIPMAKSLSLSTGPHFPSREKGHGRTASSTSNATTATGNTITQQSIARTRKKSVANSAITIATTTSGSHHVGNSPVSPHPFPAQFTFHKRRKSSGGLLTPASIFSDDAASVRALRPSSAHGLHIETNPPTPVTVAAHLPMSSTHDDETLATYHGRRQLSESQDFRPQGAHVQPPRLPHALVLSRLEKAKPSVQDALADVLRSGRVSPDEYAPTSGFWDEDEEEEEEAVSGGSWNLPVGFIVVYVCPSGDGMDSAPVMRSLLDRFSFSAKLTIEPDLYNTSPGPFKRQALISREEIERLQNVSTAVHIAPRLQNYMSSLLSATRCHPLLDPTLLTARCMADYADLVRSSRVVLGRYERSIESSEPRATPQTMSATDSDARKMLASALEHRLSVRRRPEDEVMGSLYTTAVGEVTSPNQRSTGPRRRDEEYSADDEREGKVKVERRDDGTVIVDQTIQMILHSILEDV